LLRAARTLLTLFLLLLPGTASAAAFAVVVSLSAPDTLGRWRTVETSGVARLIRDGAETPLAIGAEVAIGDTVRTGLARAELLLPSGEHLHLSEGSETVVLAERSLAQQLGEIYLRLSAPLNLTAGTVETVVEGTRFRVMVDGEAVVVQVEEGTVRVRSPAGDALLTRLQETRTGSSLAPVASRWRPGPDAFARTWPQSRPRLELMAMPVGGATLLGTRNGGALAGLQVSAGLGVGERLRLTWDSAYMRSTWQSHRLPQGLGASYQLPGSGLSLGASATATWEDQRKDCGLQYQALHVGGAGSARLRVSLGRRFALAGQAQAGWADGLSLTGGVGLGVSL
jgi:FecR protein